MISPKNNETFGNTQLTIEQKLKGQDHQPQDGKDVSASMFFESQPFKNGILDTPMES